ncbi:MAG: DUF3857 domain-containing protein [bacterium]|nr:DUF3857 domain-containing protein [bacterium]
MLFLSILLFGQFFAGKGDLVKLSYKEYKLDDSLLIVKEERKILIRTEEAREDLGTIIFPYDDSTETVEVLYARTITPEGDTVNVTENAINRVADPLVDTYPFLKNRKELHISFLSIKLGSTIEYSVERRIRNFDYVDGIEYFRTTIPIEYSRLVFYFPQKSSLRFYKGNTEVCNFSESLRDSADYKVYEIEFKNVPEIVINEWGGLPPRHLISPFVMFTTFPSWDSLIRYFSLHYRKLETIKPQKSDLNKLRELSKRIISPEREDLKIQGYVPLDRDRSASLYAMTYPEKVLRIISSFEGLSLALVLRYGCDTLHLIPSLSAIENIILYDGIKFLFPFQGEEKVMSIPYEGHVAIVLSPDLKTYSVEQIGFRDVLSDTLFIDIPRKLISFSKWVPSSRLLKSYSWSRESGEDFEDVEKFISRSKFSIYGIIKSFTASLKYRGVVDKPYFISGRVRYKSIGSRIGKYWIFYIPEMLKIEPELFKNGYYLNRMDAPKKDVCFIIKLPKGYTVKYVPQPVSYEDDKVSLMRDVEYESGCVIIKQSMAFLKRYFKYEDLVKMAHRPEVSNLTSPQVIIFERKH